MSSANPTDDRRALRSDLSSVEVVGRMRPYRIVIDEIGGRFARISEALWQRLLQGDDDRELWAQAQSAGWTRSRSAMRPRRFTPLAIRIPFGSIDRLAKALSSRSSLVFAPAAVLFWIAIVVLSLMLVISRSEQLVTSVRLLPHFYQTHPLIIGVVFLITKLVHELAHAVMCRRMGSRVGDVGVLLLCGFPSPYCDVTDIWRQPSAVRRTGVMLAGIYIELIIAALAVLVWAGANDTFIQLMALNIAIVCSISTIIFNANPLMRYDGYHILADLIGSVQLRRESSVAYRNVVTRRLAGECYDSVKRSDRRALFLAGFHVTSKIYRLFVTIAIITLLVRYADWFSLRPFAVFFVVLAVALIVARVLRGLGGVLSGEARWRAVPATRRFGSVTLLLLFVLFVGMIPLPRYRRAIGVVDSASTHVVYIQEDGLIGNVIVDYGQVVSKDDLLMQVDRTVLSLEQMKVEGKLAVAKLHGDLSRRVALQQPNSGRIQTANWKTLQAAEDGLRMQLASVKNRMRQTSLRPTTAGVVIPSHAALRSIDSEPSSLFDLQGTACRSGQAWCRVSPDGKLHAIFALNARDRERVHIGSVVMIHLAHATHRVFESKVVSVSQIEAAQENGMPVAAYQVLCPLPEVPNDQLLSWVGKECRAVFRLPSSTLASGFTSWLGDWLRG